MHLFRAIASGDSTEQAETSARGPRFFAASAFRARESRGGRRYRDDAVFFVIRARASAARL